MPQQISHPITHIAQLTRCLVRTAFRRNLLLVSGLVVVAVTVLYFARPVAAASVVWDGGGATENWSDDLNWVGDVRPGAGDVAVFDNTSSKNATIDISFNVQGIQINPTYGGFITQTAGTTLNVGGLGYIQNGGVGFSINVSGTATFAISSTFSVSGGTFNAFGGTLVFNDNQIVLTAGRFIAPTGTMTFAQGGSNQFSRTAPATFEHSGGTVIISGNSQVSWHINGIGTAGTDVFNNLTINAITGLNIDNLDTLQVLGTLNLTNGFVGSSGTLQAEGAISIATTFDGGPATLLIVGPPRTVTIPTGITGPFLSTTLNSSGSVLNSSGPGTITTARLNLVLGTIQSGASDWIVNTSYTQSGGTFTGGTGSLAFNISANFDLNGGIFNGPNTINFNDNTIILTGGQFVAPAGTMSFLQGASNQFSRFVPATFVHNGGTILVSGGAQLGWHIEGGTPGTDVLNNLTVNTNTGINLDPGDTFRITGALALTNGLISIGIFQPEGNVSIGTAFDGGNAQMIFAGAANQFVTNSGGVNPTGAWAINKSTGRVVLGSNLSLTDGQQLTITSGTLDQANFNLQTSALLSVGTNGILRNFGVGDLTLGGDVSNSGIININGGGTGCGDPGADSLQIRSTVATAVRTWSGNGTFSIVDVDVDSQAASTPPGTITAFGSSVLGPNMGAGWTLNSGCPVEINSQPTNQTACVGGMASFSVGATGTGLSFQWRRAGTPLSSGGNISIVSGPNSSTLTIDPVGGGDAASYDVVVTSSLGLTATSNPATLSLLSPPAITTNPGDTNVCAGATASFTAAASGNPTPTVQWQESIDGGANFGDISGATSTTLSFTASASQNGNKYRAVFSNSCNSATTTAATLTVNPPDLAIDKSHTGDFTVGTNGVYTITVTNSGTCSTTGTITVTDTLPNGLSFISGTGTTWSCSANGQDVTCTNTGPLAGAAVSTITLTVSVAQAAVPSVTNTASVSTSDDGNAANNSDSDPTTVNGAGPPINPGDLIISEFRVRGPNGASDEFVEIYNNTDANITVVATDGSSGFALVASDGVARFVIPNNTIIPARGHFLGVNSVEYSLGSYPGGNAPTGGKVYPRPRREPRTSAEGEWDLGEDTVNVGGPPQPLTPTATGDVTYTTEILDNAGIALFNTANPANFIMANRLDAVGSVAETNTLYKEGTDGLPNLNPDLIPQETEYSWVRRLPGGCTGTDPAGFNNNCTTPTLVQNTAPPSLGRSQDTDNNAADFLFVSTNGGTGAGLSEDLQRLGAPGPENLSAPIVRGNPSGSGTINPSLIDTAVASSSPPNRERVTCPTPGTCGANQTFGTLDIRRRFTNNTGASLTRLRFRIMDISTFPNGPGIADIRALTSLEVMVVTSGGTVTVSGTTLEEDTSAPNLGQPMGGGYNSSLSAGVITLATPLNPGASVNMRFVFGVQANGKFRVFVVVEALP